MSLIRHPALLLAWLTLALAGALVTATGRAEEETEPRFSSTLSPAQQAETGLSQLTSDNVAVIDALVRLDVAAIRLRNNNIRTTRFSQRHTEHERDIAGLARLTPEQLAKLDQFVSLRIPAPAPALPLTTDLPYASISLEAVPAYKKHPAPEIHGSVSLTYGWSKGGSVRGADTTLMYVDPKHRFDVIVGYSEYHGKGLAPYPYFADGPYFSPYYRPLPVVLPEDR